MNNNDLKKILLAVGCLVANGFVLQTVSNAEEFCVGYFMGVGTLIAVALCHEL